MDCMHACWNAQVIVQVGGGVEALAWDWQGQSLLTTHAPWCSGGG